MSLEDALKVAAREAAAATKEAMRKYSRGEVTDEDDLTGVLIGQLDSKMKGRLAGLTWTGTILRHRRGLAAQESRAGADLLLHVKLRVRGQSYSKGVLVQAKRVEPGEAMNAAQHDHLLQQCRRMLAITPASFVFDYAKSGIKAASATKVAGSTDGELFKQCKVTPYRFFYELFRCPIGDPRINSGSFDDLAIPAGLSLEASGDIGDD